MLTMIFGAIGFVRNSWVGKAVAIAFAVASAFFIIRRSGYKAAQADQKDADMEFGEDIRSKDNDAKIKAIREVGDLSHDDLSERMRGKGRLRD